MYLCKPLGIKGNKLMSFLCSNTPDAQILQLSIIILRKIDNYHCQCRCYDAQKSLFHETFNHNHQFETMKILGNS